MAQTSTSTSRRRFAAFFLAGLLLTCTVFSGATAASQRPLPVQPAVLEWMQQHPGQPVPLIVQHDGTAADLRTFVVKVGGTIGYDFHIVPALDATVPADEVSALARQHDVNWVSLDAPVQSTGGSLDLSKTAQVYGTAVNANDAWNKSIYGAGVTVAVVDTGASSSAQSNFLDDSGRSRLQTVSTNPNWNAQEDGYGHGTHIAGIIAGYSNGPGPKGKYAGVAPRATVLGVRIADDQGNATVGDLIAGLQYVDDNRAAYNIRVLNLSVSSSVAQSYRVDPIDAAVELLWFHNITVVVAAGNLGSAADAVNYPPANDPFVLTVGAFDDKGTSSYGDDALTSWSSRGVTQDGIAKPDLVAPGKSIIAPVSPASYLATTYPSAVVEVGPAGTASYFRMSGTSMAAGVMSGAVALVVQAHPDWSPGQIKATLIATARKLNGSQALAPRVGDTNNQSNPKGNTDDGLQPSYILLSALGVADTDFDGVRWRDATFSGVRWRGLELNGVRWRDVDWTGIRWSSVSFDGLRWGGASFDGLRWGGIRWGSFVGQ